MNPRTTALGALAALLLAPSALAQCWKNERPVPFGRFEGLSLEVDGDLYVFGGFGKFFQALTNVDVFDPQTGQWSARAPMPVPVTHIGMARDDRTVWIAGGFAGTHPGVATDAVWTYDLDLDQWAPGPALPRPVASGALAVTDRDLHWFGGLEADRDTNVADHWVLDLDDVAGGWSSLAPMPEPRCHFAAVVLGGRIHALGGQYRHDTNPLDVDLHHVYDPANDTWSTAAPLLTARSHFEPGTMVFNGHAVIVGGRSNQVGLSQMRDVTAYDPVADRWTALRSLPEARLAPSAKVLGNRLYVTAGTQADFQPRTEHWSVPASLTAPAHLRVNCGGPRYVATDHAVWCADEGFLAGDAFANPAVPDVANTDDDELYRTYRTSAPWAPDHLDYRLPADDGKYRLRLHFAEIRHGATGYGGPSVGQRVMRVVVEGVQHKAYLDVANKVGVEAALTLTFDFEASGGAVDLTLVASVGEPMVSAMELLRLPDDAFEVFCTSYPNTTGSAAEIAFTGSASLAANELRLTAAPVPDEFGLFFYGANETDVPFGHGRRCIASPIYRLPAKAVNGGTLAHLVNLLQPPKPGGQILAGSSWIFQGWFRDTAAGGPGFNSSSALRLLFTD